MRDLNSYIGIGLSHSFVPLNVQPGSRPGSWGYHANDGISYNCGSATSYGSTSTTGDVVGCGINFERQHIFYTRNGLLLGIVFDIMGYGSPDDIFPFLGLQSIGERVYVNFGTRKFLFDIANYQSK